MNLGIIYILETDNYQKTLKELINICKSKDIQLIILNKIDDIMATQFLKNYNDEFTVLNCFGKSLYQCLNVGLNQIKTKYVNIQFSNTSVPKKTLSRILKKIGNSEIYCLNCNKNLNSKEKMNNINLQTHIESYIFKSSILKHMKIIETDCDYDVVIQILLEYLNKYEIEYLKKYKMTTQNKLEKSCCYQKKWYTYSIENIYIPILHKDKLNKYSQALIYYSIFQKFIANKNSGNKEILIGDERKEFFSKVGELLKLIDDDVILSVDYFNNKRKNSYDFKYLMIYLKKNIENYQADFDDNGIYSIINNEKVYVNSNVIEIDAINYNQNEIIIDAHYNYYNVFESLVKHFSVLVNGKKIDIQKNDIYSLTKYFALSTSKKYTFQFKVPIVEDKLKIQFLLQIGSREYLFPLRFVKPASRLTNKYKNSYWQYKNIILKYKNDMLIFRKNNIVIHFICEIIFMFDLLIKSPRFYKFKNLFLRIIYWLLKPIYSKKRIWLYFDKLYKADDNGEHQVEYAMNQNDDILHYYVINKDSYDYDRLKNKGIKLLKFNSIKHKLFSLYAENIVATHPDIIKFCGYGKRLEKAFRGLFNANIICIAHGLTIQKNAEVQNRLYDNTMFYTTSSIYEIEHLKEPIYGYEDNQLALTGLARFDMMKSHEKKQILISPTWRRSVSGTSNMNLPKGYNEEFKNSVYFKIYNSLINDKKLIECAKRNNYTIIFLLHPAMSAQQEDYDKNDYVILMQATSDMSYKKILTESALMVTDYSGIQYDFAYMHKPIVYYHPTLLPPRFEEGALKYDTMGFGPICKEHDEIINTLIKYIDNDCKIEKKYDKRINDFFAFHDYNNCERIYNAIMKFTYGVKNERK